MGRVRIGFRMPVEMYEKWKDKAIEGLVGQTADFSMFGEPTYKVRVVDARRLDDEMLGKGIWVEVERV